MAAGLLRPGSTVLDYGCGHGADVRYLKSKKVKAWGWDPHYAPDPKALRPAEVVNLGFVLNVIEDPVERIQTLRRAYQLANRVLLVAVRVDRELASADPYGDGVLTASGTFQKLYAQDEFLRLLGEELGVRPHAAGLGIALVFKDAELERAHLGSQAFSVAGGISTEQIHQFEKDATARRFVALANRLGRFPTATEFPRLDRLVDRFGSPSRVRRLLLRHVAPERFAQAAQQRREDTLTFLAMLRLRGSTIPLGLLPEDAREDVRAFWASYAAARAESEAFLFSLGKPEEVAAACARATVGKLLPKDLYVHRSAEEELPPLLRLLAFAARQVIGPVDYDLLKLATDGRAVSFLKYDGFEEDPHPALTSSIRIYLPKSAYDIRDYRDSLNPPILHRKDAFVSDAHPSRPAFQALTRQEEEAGLLCSTEIGFRRQWQELLTARGLDLLGHTLIVTRSGIPTAAAGEARQLGQTIGEE